MLARFQSVPARHADANQVWTRVQAAERSQEDFHPGILNFMRCYPIRDDVNQWSMYGSFLCVLVPVGPVIQCSNLLKVWRAQSYIHVTCGVP